MSRSMASSDATSPKTLDFRRVTDARIDQVVLKINQ